MLHETVPPRQRCALVRSAEPVSYRNQGLVPARCWAKTTLWEPGFARRMAPQAPRMALVYTANPPALRAGSLGEAGLLLNPVFVSRLVAGTPPCGSWALWGWLVRGALQARY